jgi:hypothetical protein
MSDIVYIPEECEHHDVVFIPGRLVKGKGIPVTGVFCVPCGNITYPESICPGCWEIGKIHGEGCDLVLL